MFSSESITAVDVILPAGWGTCSWIPLLFNGAVAAGTDHPLHLMMEEHLPPPPYLIPDTAAGKEYARMLGEERRAKFFQRPPNMRMNMIKLKVQYPFFHPWAKLVNSLATASSIASGLLEDVQQALGLQHNTIPSNEDGTVCVIRNSSYLNALKFLVCRSGSKRRVFRGIEENEKFVVAKDCQPLDRVSLSHIGETLSLMTRTCQDSLLYCTLTVIGKGAIEPCAMVCLPKQSDIALLESKLKGGEDLEEALSESAAPDTNEKHRKLRRNEHKKLLVMRYFIASCYVELCPNIFCTIFFYI